MSNEELDEFYCMDGDEMMETDDPEPKAILGDLLSEGETMMIFAPGGTGKTMLALSIANAIATGKETLGWVAENATPIVYVDGEMLYNRMKSRLKVITGDRIPKNFNLIHHSKLPPGEYIDISDIQSQKKLFNTLTRIKAKVLIIDNLSCLTTLENENDASSWTVIERFYRKLNNIGISVILLHHPTKTGQDPRGSARKVDSIDTCIKLSAPEIQPSPELGGPEIELKFTKNRNNPSLNKVTKQLVFIGDAGKWVSKKEFLKIQAEHDKY